MAILSRVAESVFWLNRYVERAENYSRFIDVNFQLSLELGLEPEDHWSALIDTTGDKPIFDSLYDKCDRTNVIHFMTFQQENPNSILNCLKYARENARSIRENISTDMWEVLNEFYLTFKERVHFKEGEMEKIAEFFRYIRNSCLHFYGSMDSSISHDEVYFFGIAGRSLERADKTTRILDMKYFILLPSLEEVGSTMDLLQWLSLLKSASAHEMYNRSYQRIEPKSIAEFLILNLDFPRAIRSCLKSNFAMLKKISGSGPETYANAAEKIAGQTLSKLNFTSISEIWEEGLHQYLDKIQIDLNAIGSGIQSSYFRDQEE